MERIDALKELLAKVEAGTAEYSDFHAMAVDLVGMHGRAYEAYHGSLGAAESVHDTVLLEWMWHVTSSGTAILDGPEFAVDVKGGKYRPARAWICAILKALIKQGVA